MITEAEIRKKQKTFSETDMIVADAFKVLSDVHRYRIFRVLSEQPKLSVSNIAKILGISLPLASQHIKLLIRAKLLQKEKDGKKVYPKLEDKNPLVKTMVKAIQETIKIIE